MDTTFDVIFQEVKETTKKIKRDFYLRKIIGFGKIKEECDRILCYVGKRDILKFRKNKFSNICDSREYFYDIKLNDMVQEDENVVGVKPGKTIYYIFDGIDFSDNVEIQLNKSNVVFKNCTFGKNIAVHSFSKVLFKDCVFKFHIDIMGSADVKFQHNKYKPCRLANESFLDVLNSKKITFLKDSFIVSSESSEKLFYTPRFGFQIVSEKVDIIDSKIDINNIESSISTKQLLLEKSLINVEDISIKANTLKMDDSLIVGEKRVVLNLDQDDLLCTIKAPAVFCNGMKLESKLQEQNVVQESIQIDNERRKLIECLSTINSFKQQIESKKDDSEYKMVKRNMR